MAQSSTNPPGVAAQPRRIPRVDVDVSFDRPTHSYSQRNPPNITHTITLRAEHPITIPTRRTPLNPSEALTSRGYVITNLTTGNPVRTANLVNYEEPLLRTRGFPDEDFFLTLYPNVTVELSTGFGRHDGHVKPRSREAIEHSWERKNHDNEESNHCHVEAIGVDGLEPGHTYSVDLCPHGLNLCEWAPVTADKILVDEWSYVDEYPWTYSMDEERPLEFRTRGATIYVVD
ncbi:hypothetical protein F5X98DRAFT_381426 [Xylaria grammica]|nr:hypothetical protein F5X98DRAFT_381426 [Xylaria grammica]